MPPFSLTTPVALLLPRLNPTTLKLKLFPLLLHRLNPRIAIPQQPSHSLLGPTMSWTCSKCTFDNPAYRKSTCQICGSSSAPSSSSAASSSFSIPLAPKWSCSACTFLNQFESRSCEVCGTSASTSSFSTFEQLIGDDELDPSVGSVFLPLRRCSKRKNREDPVDDNEVILVDDAQDSNAGTSSTVSMCKTTQLCEVNTNGGSSSTTWRMKTKKCAAESAPDSNKDTNLTTLKILSYNVWFREDLEVYKRMKAIGELIQLHSPDVICFQEVTANIHNIFKQSTWWKLYKCSVSVEKEVPYFCMQLSKLPVVSFSRQPFYNTIMGRELCITEIEVKGNKRLVVATSHLESPCPAPPTWNQMFSKERVDQAKEAIGFLKRNRNVIFCGDMNWDDKGDGQFPLPEGWVDAWTELRPADPGLTYDTKSNQMLSGNRSLRKRLDRFACSLQDFKLSEIDMIGTEAIPGLSYCKEKKMKNETRNLTLPVLPSDHYGLLLTINLM